MCIIIICGRTDGRTDDSISGPGNLVCGEVGFRLGSFLSSPTFMRVDFWVGTVMACNLPIFSLTNSNVWARLDVRHRVLSGNGSPAREACEIFTPSK